MNEDQLHLRLLSVFHYIVAGIVALFSLLPLFHLAIGVAMITGQLDTGETRDPMAILMGLFFVGFAAAWIVSGIVFAACLVIAGFFLSQQRHYVFCLIVAGLACMFVPFGTVLGVFTIVVLMRPSVKKLFDQD
jgi:hypothetical protein